LFNNLNKNLFKKYNLTKRKVRILYYRKKCIIVFINIVLINIIVSNVINYAAV